jgi:serine/threonine protein kinase
LKPQIARPEDTFKKQRPQFFEKLLRNPAHVALEPNQKFFSAPLKDGRYVQFRDISAAPFLMQAASGAMQDEAIYDEFREQHQSDTEDFRPPDWLLVRDADAQDNTTAAFALVDREQFTTDPNYAGKFFMVWATFTVDPKRALSNMPVVQMRKPPPSQKDLAIQFLEQQGYDIDRKRLGQGAFGAAFTAERNGQTEVLKLFVDSGPGAKGGALKAEVMTGRRELDTYGDFYASYLHKASDPHWEKPLIIHPGSYIVEQPAGGAGFEAISVADFKQRARLADAAGAGLKCVGLVMQHAPGNNVQTLLQAGRGMPGGLNDAKRMAKSGLRTLKSLNERGLMHRDIKPANMNFDAQAGELHFFDTGLMFKIKKTDADRRRGVSDKDAQSQRFDQLPIGRMGTSGYMHPTMVAGEQVGTQADLHSFGLTLLQSAYSHLNMATLRTLEPISNEDSISREELEQKLTQLAASGPDSQARDQARQFLQDVRDSSSMANLIMGCMEMADTQVHTAAQWANRQFSDERLQVLMNHPSLAQVA